MSLFATKPVQKILAEANATDGPTLAICHLAVKLISFLWFGICTLAAPPAKNAPLVFVDVTVIDCAGSPARPNQMVIVEGNRITSIGRNGSLKKPAGATIIDGSGKFLIPGLWDMHVHLLWEPVSQFLPLCVANGVTGIRDLHTKLTPEEVNSLRQQISEGQAVGPRLIASGPIVDGPQPWWPGSVAVTNAADAREAVRRLKREGRDLVKVYEGLPRTAYFALADEAKRQRIPFVGHTPGAITAAEAADAGQKSIEHLSRVWESCYVREGESFVFDERKAAALLALFKKKQTWQCPTLVVRVGSYRRLSEITNDSRLKYISKDVQARAYWNEAREDPAGRRARFQQQLELVGRMQREGLGLLAGTDAIMPYVFPGFSLHDELGLLVKAGLSPLAALQAATLNPARFLGLEKSLGTVEKGKLADLVLLEANPLADINNTKRISAVVANGHLFDRLALDKLLNEVEAIASANNSRRE